MQFKSLLLPTAFLLLQLALGAATHKDKLLCGASGGLNNKKDVIASKSGDCNNPADALVLCAANPDCKSFAFGKGNCIAYKVDAKEAFVSTKAGGKTDYYDFTCPMDSYLKAA